MTDIVMVNYNTKMLIEFQRNHFVNSGYNLVVVENSSFESERVEYTALNSLQYSFDGDSHGSSIDIGILNTTSEYVVIMDTDFLLYDPTNIDVLIKHMKDNDLDAIGTPYDDGLDTKKYTTVYPECFYQIPCIFFLVVRKCVLESLSFKISQIECELNKNSYGCYVEVGFQLRKTCFENKLRTETFDMFQLEPGYGKCFYKWKNDVIGYHHFAGSHRNKESVVNVLKKYRDEYNDKNV